MSSFESPHDLFIDVSKVAKTFNQVSSIYDDVAILQRNTADNLIERLSFMTLEPATILDVGCGTGYAALKLAKHYKNSDIIHLDIASNMLQIGNRSNSVCADTHQLPFNDNSFDFLFSNLMLPWCCDLNVVFQEWQRILKPEGLLMFSTFGPDTLKELRASWDAVDEMPHVHSFLDLKEIGNALMYAGFAEPVVDVDHHQFIYSNLKRLMMDLKRSGGHNLSTDRLRGLTGKKKWQQMLEGYEQYRTPETKNRFPVTYEIIYGQAWGSDLNNDNSLSSSSEDGGEINIPLAQIRRDY